MWRIMPAPCPNIHWSRTIARDVHERSAALCMTVPDGPATGPRHDGGNESAMVGTGNRRGNRQRCPKSDTTPSGIGDVVLGDDAGHFPGHAHAIASGATQSHPYRHRVRRRIRPDGRPDVVI